ncbi:hypothetical protein E3T39_09185 [Cryobacterium suzukii]|uniref:Uncharacterized protein n=1 Tax=Cryobacterium suzukii TaxID=1259198 RepID=A0A4R9AF73_9MICO|nr:hypothetical protein E3T39_09185 [Cryobacterium suzukii]
MRDNISQFRMLLGKLGEALRAALGVSGEALQGDKRGIHGLAPVLSVSEERSTAQPSVCWSAGPVLDGLEPVD